MEVVPCITVNKFKAVVCLAEERYKVGALPHCNTGFGFGVLDLVKQCRLNDTTDRREHLFAQKRLNGEIYLIVVVQVDQKLKILHLVGNILPQVDVGDKTPFVFIKIGGMRMPLFGEELFFVGVVCAPVVAAKKSSSPKSG